MLLKLLSRLLPNDFRGGALLSGSAALAISGVENVLGNVLLINGVKISGLRDLAFNRGDLSFVELAVGIR
jgi:hypothetical protein